MKSLAEALTKTDEFDEQDTSAMTLVQYYQYVGARGAYAHNARLNELKNAVILAAAEVPDAEHGELKEALAELRKAVGCG